MRSESQHEFDLGFYASILRHHPDYVDVLRKQGELLSRNGRYEEALAVDRRLAALRPDDCIVHYNLGCSLARARHHREAIAALRKAFELGYIDYRHLETDCDLENLRDEPEFKALLHEFGASE